jgi:hypothetical protein
MANSILLCAVSRQWVERLLLSSAITSVRLAIVLLVS